MALQELDHRRRRTLEVFAEVGGQADLADRADAMRHHDERMRPPAGGSIEPGGAACGSRSEGEVFSLIHCASVRSRGPRNDSTSAIRMGARNTTKVRRTPAQSRSRATVDAILTATTYVLAERGFAGATSNRIAKRAGVNVATFYRYFPNKDALVGALIEREARATLEVVDAALAETRGQSLEAAIRALFSAMLGHQHLDPRAHRELVEQVGRSGRLATLRELERDIGGRLQTLIAAHGRSADPAVTAFVVLHAAEALVHAILFLRSPEIDRAAATRSAIEMIVGFLT